jgi:hypothetical protein
MTAGRKDVHLFEEQFMREERKKRMANTDYFYNTYIPHTNHIFYNRSDIESFDWSKYDAFLVGSDQVWRPAYAAFIGVENYFFNFVKDDSKPKIAYAVSFGEKNTVFSEALHSQLCALYSKFKAVSVRESIGVDILESNGMAKPKAIPVLDPTFLLTPENYGRVIKESKISEHNNKYVLSYFIVNTPEKDSILKAKAKELELDTVFMSTESSKDISIPQWLYNFNHADFIVTDSFHGTVFSILYNKPFKLLSNKLNDESRTANLLHMFDITDTTNVDWDKVNSLIEKYRKESFNFLKSSLS